MLKFNINYEQNIRAAYKNRRIQEWDYISRQLRRTLPARFKEINQLLASGRAQIMETVPQPEVI